MYSLIIREDTIRIPAEYIRAGRKLEEHIDELAHDAFECRFDENEDFTRLRQNRPRRGPATQVADTRRARPSSPRHAE